MNRAEFERQEAADLVGPGGNWLRSGRRRARLRSPSARQWLRPENSAVV
jgi:hypothetical protein